MNVNLSDILVVVGTSYLIYLLVKISFSFVATLKTYFLSKFLFDKDLSSKYSAKWAVITGASEGIGCAYAFKLAERKMNVLLISRNERKLKMVTKILSDKFHVKTQYLACDLTSMDQETIFDSLKKTFDGLDIGILVNNVGAIDCQGCFLQSKLSSHIRTIDLNIKALVAVTYMILPQMVARQNGAIINMSSFTSICPMPYLSVYSASKFFVDSFSKILQEEYPSIFIQSIRPSFVSTNLINKPSVDSIFVADADVFVDNAIRTLGVSRQNHGYWKHGLFGFFVSLLPERLIMSTAIYVYPLVLKKLTNITIAREKLN